MTDVVRATVEEFFAHSGLTRRARSWYRRTDETIVVLTLSRLPYGRQYSLSVGVVLRTLDADENPKDKHCPLRSRFDRLVPPTVEHRLNDLLDSTSDVPADERRAELLDYLGRYLRPVVEASGTLEGLRSGDGRVLVRTSSISDLEARALVLK